MQVRVKVCADGVDRFDAKVFQSFAELGDRHIDAFEEALVVGLFLSGVFNGALEVVENRDHLLEEAVIGKTDRVFLVALVAFASILKICPLTQIEVPIFVGFSTHGFNFILQSSQRVDFCVSFNLNLFCAVFDDFFRRFWCCFQLRYVLLFTFLGQGFSSPNRCLYQAGG